MLTLSPETYAALLGSGVTGIMAFFVAWINAHFANERSKEEHKNQVKLQKFDLIKKEQINWLKELKSLYADYVSLVQCTFNQINNVNILIAQNADISSVIKDSDDTEIKRIRISRLIIANLDNNNETHETLSNLVSSAEKELGRFWQSINTNKLDKCESNSQKYHLILSELSHTDEVLSNLSEQANICMQEISRAFWKDLDKA